MQMEPATSMFPDDITASRHNIVFVAACSLGIPLALCPTPNNSGWTELSDKLKGQFAREPFEVVQIEHHPETSFPLGTPLTIRSSHLFGIFDLRRYQAEATIFPENYRLDHVIWICPTGIVLIIGRISFDDDVPIDLASLNEVVFERHYAELGYVFNEVAEAVVAALPSEFLRRQLCCGKDVERIRKGVLLRDENSLRARGSQAVVEWLSDHAQARAIYDNSVLDVYFIDYNPTQNGSETPEVDYFKSSIVSVDPTYLLMVAIAYSSFAGLIWLTRHLDERVETLQTCMVGQSRLNSDVSSELKLLRIFCLRFISESDPISIRLKTPYMKCLERCWEPYRMDKLIEQVNEQLTTLEKIADWIDDQISIIRDRKISLAAVTLAIVSITAVAAQLISTVDVKAQLGGVERSLFILVGFVIGGILSTLVVFLLPISGKRLVWKK